jgi:NADH:ubiquinone oxidoreductase subunit K
MTFFDNILSMMQGSGLQKLGIEHFLVLSTILFGIGIFGFLTRRNLIGILMSLELMFNAVNINLIAFSRWSMGIEGQVLALFTLAVAAAETTLGIAIIFNIYRRFNDVNIEQLDFLKW